MAGRSSLLMRGLPARHPVTLNVRKKYDRFEAPLFKREPTAAKADWNQEKLDSRTLRAKNIKGHTFQSQISDKVNLENKKEILYDGV